MVNEMVIGINTRCMVNGMVTGINNIPMVNEMVSGMNTKCMVNGMVTGINNRCMVNEMVTGMRTRRQINTYQKQCIVLQQFVTLFLRQYEYPGEVSLLPELLHLSWREFIPPPLTGSLWGWERKRGGEGESTRKNGRGKEQKKRRGINSNKSAQKWVA